MLRKRIFLNPYGGVNSNMPTHVQSYIIDESKSDPNLMLTGDFGKDGTPDTNVISWIRANSHRYVGTYDAGQGMLLKQLDDNDSTKYADDTNASEDIKGTNGGDVFVRIPTFWFKGETLDSNRTAMYFTLVEPNDDTWTKWDENTLIGAYEAYSSGTMFCSRSGKTISSSLSRSNAREYARKRSNGDDRFRTITYDAHKVIVLLFWGYYGTTNSKEICGRGTSAFKETGQTNYLGMKDTDSENGNTHSINFWGLENCWGNFREWLDDIYIDNGGVIKILDYNSKEIRQFQAIASSNDIYVPIKLVLSEKLDVVVKEYISNKNHDTYYCDSIEVYHGPSYTGSRSGWRNDDKNGVSYLDLYGTASINTTSRLLYEGRVIII